MANISFPNESIEYRAARNALLDQEIALRRQIEAVAEQRRALPSIGERASLYIVAKSPIARLIAWARVRGWAHLQFLSTAGNRYSADYFGETSKLPAAIRKEWNIGDGEDYDETMFNVFRLDHDTVRHFWGSELTWAPQDPGQHHRSGDAVNALWGLLDMTPEGRGQFMPKLAY